MTDLAVIGCGYVGAVSAACLADLGHSVECIDIDDERIRELQNGRCPVYEPRVDELLRRGLAEGRLSFRSSYPSSMKAEIAFIAVNTPGSSEGAADMRAVRDAVAAIAPLLPPGAIIVNKSTVPIGTGTLVAGMACRAGRPDIQVVSNPEFLREGNAVEDFLRPGRIVLGSDDPTAVERVARVYQQLDAPVLKVDIRTAEMIKYASNAFLATKISFMNEIAAICDALGADVTAVARGMGLDDRIGSRFLDAGLGWGGSCFPKDVNALAHTAGIHGTTPQLLRSVIEINSQQRLRMVSKLRSALGSLEGSAIAVLGAAFKPHTDDTRNSPAIELANLLVHSGAEVRLYDPVVRPHHIREAAPRCDVVSDTMQAVQGADAVVIATEWPEFARLDFAEVRRAMRGDTILDARNMLDPVSLEGSGLRYLAVGRPSAEAHAALQLSVVGR